MKRIPTIAKKLSKSIVCASLYISTPCISMHKASQALTTIDAPRTAQDKDWSSFCTTLLQKHPDTYDSIKERPPTPYSLKKYRVAENLSKKIDYLARTTSYAQFKRIQNYSIAKAASQKIDKLALAASYDQFKKTLSEERAELTAENIERLQKELYQEGINAIKEKLNELEEHTNQTIEYLDKKSSHHMINSTASAGAIAAGTAVTLRTLERLPDPTTLHALCHTRGDGKNLIVPLLKTVVAPAVGVAVFTVLSWRRFIKAIIRGHEAKKAAQEKKETMEQLKENFNDLSQEVEQSRQLLDQRLERFEKNLINCIACITDDTKNLRANQTELQQKLQQTIPILESMKKELQNIKDKEFKKHKRTSSWFSRSSKHESESTKHAPPTSLRGRTGRRKSFSGKSSPPLWTDQNQPPLTPVLERPSSSDEDQNPLNQSFKNYATLQVPYSKNRRYSIAGDHCSQYIQPDYDSAIVPDDVKQKKKDKGKNRA